MPDWFGAFFFFIITYGLINKRENEVNICRGFVDKMFANGNVTTMVLLLLDRFAVLLFCLSHPVAGMILI